ncbi:MAG: prepilin-type N-terminal cleavage/methylation domain-containing protein [bacterium]
MKNHFTDSSKRNRSAKGFTLIELVLVIVIIGLLATTALRTGGALFETAKVEETRQEMDALAFAIVGNPALENNGVRADFGYVGDVGALPPNLEALYANPGGYATWKGPYIGNRFTQTATDFKTDAWGTGYAYGGITVTSTGSGSNIVRQIAGSTDELLRNRTSGTLTDSDGTPPGAVYRDSVTMQLQYPNGAGSTATKSVHPDAGGYFTLDSLPIGNHQLTAIYAPDNDTLYRMVSITSGSSTYAEYRLNTNVWYGASGSGIILVPDGDSLVTDCDGFTFWILNTSSGPVDISSITVTYPGLTGYYRYVRWNGTTVVDENNPAIGSGEVAAFGAPQTIDSGESVRITIDAFKDSPTGGADVKVENTTFTILLSDGSTFDVITGGCP